MEAKAILKHIRIAPRKIRLVADAIRGLDVMEAERQLKFIFKKAAHPVLKLLNSAIANAEHNFNLKKENLFIKVIMVDEGPPLKRWRARAFGRAAPIKKRSSHVTIVLDERVKTAKSKEKNKKKLSGAEIAKAAPKESLISEDLNNGGRKQEDIPHDFKEGKKEEPFDVRMPAKHRHQQHLDKTRRKERGMKNATRGIFRRKTD